MEILSARQGREALSSKAAILVLGEGHNDDGTLVNEARVNVERAVQLYVQLKNEGISPEFVMSTRWHYNRPNVPLVTEAQAMKNYAVALGVPEKAMTLEEESLDTMGNVFFSKKIIDRMPDVKEIYVVFADYHAARSKYLVDTIFGDKYETHLVESEQGYAPDVLAKKIAAEEKGLERYRRLLTAECRGDDERIGEVLERFPQYGDDTAKTDALLKEFSEFQGPKDQLLARIVRNRGQHLKEILRK